MFIITLIRPYFLGPGVALWDPLRFSRKSDEQQLTTCLTSFRTSVKVPSTNVDCCHDAPVAGVVHDILKVSRNTEGAGHVEKLRISFIGRLFGLFKPRSSMITVSEATMISKNAIIES